MTAGISDARRGDRRFSLTCALLFMDLKPTRLLSLNFARIDKTIIINFAKIVGMGLGAGIHGYFESSEAIRCHSALISAARCPPTRRYQ